MTPRGEENFLTNTDKPGVGVRWSWTNRKPKWAMCTLLISFSPLRFSFLLKAWKWFSSEMELSCSCIPRLIQASGSGLANGHLLLLIYYALRVIVVKLRGWFHRPPPMHMLLSLIHFRYYLDLLCVTIISFSILFVSGKTPEGGNHVTFSIVLISTRDCRAKRWESRN